MRPPSPLPLPPPQHQEIGELRKLLRSAEALLSSEREANGRKALQSALEAGEQEERARRLLEQLRLLRQELERSQRDRTRLEEEAKACREEIRQVRPPPFRFARNEK